MVKIEKLSNELSCYLSRIYTLPKHAASYAGLDKLYCAVRKEFPTITCNQIKH